MDQKWCCCSELLVVRRRCDARLGPGQGGSCIPDVSWISRYSDSTRVVPLDSSRSSRVNMSIRSISRQLSLRIPCNGPRASASAGAIPFACQLPTVSRKDESSTKTRRSKRPNTFIFRPVVDTRACDWLADEACLNAARGLVSAFG
jgi:hypothetical protein